MIYSCLFCGENSPNKFCSVQCKLEYISTDTEEDSYYYSEYDALQNGNIIIRLASENNEYVNDEIPF